MTNVPEYITKLARPSSERLYHREALVQKLNTAMSSSAVWITGPPGAGKTALVASYLCSNDRPAVWYQVDENDTDIATLLWYLRMAAAGDTSNEAGIPLYSREYSGGLHRFLLRYFETLYSTLQKRFVIILDDFRYQDSYALFADVVRKAIEYLPQQGNIIITARDPVPAAFTRLISNGQLSVLNGHDLALSADEASAIARQIEPSLTDALARVVAQRTLGWAAGLRLTLQDINAENDLPEAQPEHCGSTVAAYFHEEVMNRQPEETQLLITRLSVVPFITESTARSLSGDNAIGKLLDWLTLHNCFLSVKHTDKDVYRFHPLFRLYLLELLENAIGSEALIKLRETAAEIMEEEGFSGAAADLYAAAGNWPAVCRLIISDAQTMLDQGRVRTLERRISLVPRDLVAEDARLCYWLGRSQMFRDGRQAHEYFARAFALYRQEENRDGAMAAWTGAINSLLSSWGELQAIDEWISRGENMISPAIKLPAQPIDAQAVTAMCFALYLARPHCDQLAQFTAVTHALLASSDDTLFRIMGANLLVIFYSWQGENAKSRMLMDAVRPDEQALKESELLAVMWSGAECWFKMTTGEARCSRDMARDGLSMAEQSGIHVFDYRFHGVITQSLLLLGEYDEARKSAQRYLEYMPHGAFLIQYHAYYLAAWERFMQGAQHVAREYLHLARSFLSLSGNLPVIAAKLDIADAILGMQAGEHAEALRKIEAAYRLAVATSSHWLLYHCLLLLAADALRVKRGKRCARRLDEALSIAKEHELTVTDWWNRKMMRDLFEFALERDIGSEQVRRIVTKTGLLPSARSCASPAWPWPVKIRLLGEFEVSLDGQKLARRQLRQTKTLELLKVLALGSNTNLSNSHVADMLWPDAEGDDAHNALKTTTHRLRQLLKSQVAIEVSNGFIRLNPDLCWTDVRAFELLAGTHQSSEMRITNLKRAMALYKGTLLHGHSDEQWIIGQRTRLRARARQAVLELGREWENRMKWNKAVSCYKRGIDTIGPDEQLCNRLIRCYQASGRHDDAMAAYEQYSTELGTRAADLTRPPGAGLRSPARPRVRH